VFAIHLSSHVLCLFTVAYIRLNKNGLVGEVPTEMGNLSLLRELWLWENGIEGQIPSELGLMKDMGKPWKKFALWCALTLLLTRCSSLLTENMEIYENQFTGTIPEEIYSLTQMTSLDVNLCRLTGTLSTRIGQLTKMQRFRVSTNDLTGTIPEETANLTSIGK
jgi:Leucine-rich repeat (LRR) protein